MCYELAHVLLIFKIGVFSTTRRHKGGTWGRGNRKAALLAATQGPPGYQGGASEFSGVCGDIADAIFGYLQSSQITERRKRTNELVAPFSALAFGRGVMAFTQIHQLLMQV